MKLILIGDVHGNSVALNSCIVDALEQMIKSDEKDFGFVFLGDYVTDFPMSQEVVNTMRKLSERNLFYAITGNREQGMVRSYYNSKGNVDWDINSTMGDPLVCMKDLSYDNLEYLATLPDTLDIDLPNAPKLYLCHRMPLSKEQLAHIKENNIKYVLVADTHQTNEQILDDNITLINPGSVGLSDEDLGNGTGTYTILTLNNNKWDSENRTFNYDTELARHKLRKYKELYTSCKNWGVLLECSMDYGFNACLLYVLEAFRLQTEKMNAKKENRNVNYEPLDNYNEIFSMDNSTNCDIYGNAIKRSYLDNEEDCYVIKSDDEFFDKNGLFSLRSSDVDEEVWNYALRNVTEYYTSYLKNNEIIVNAKTHFK